MNMLKQSIDKMSLGDRMKLYYEASSKNVLTMRVPVIMRLDGRAFHTLTKKLDKPFDEEMIAMSGLIINVLKLKDE